MAQVYNSVINFTFTGVTVTKMAAKIGWKLEIDHSETSLGHLTEKLT